MTTKPKDYKQSDPKWAKKMYSSRGDKSQTMKNSGCAPTAAADVIATFCDPTIDPYDIAQLYMKKGYRKDGKGTLPGCFKWTALRYKGKGIRKFSKLKKHANAKAAIAQGALAIAHMGPGYWTNGGHYIVVWKWEDGVVYACDPGSSKRKNQAEGPFMRQVKSGYYVFWP